ncbi:MAG TPA: aminotransferase class V-fold PLP-dependent enzyme [Vicinamibacterales bacterium]|nr:aminotransferase class V-fold PLP-dependent enzyme [Vicinamibacterales bacterium]
MTRQPDPERTGTPRRDAPLAIPGDEFRRLGHLLVDSVAAFLDSVPDRPLTPAESPESVRALLDASRALPAEGSDAEALLASTSRLLFDHSLFNGHPRFFGYITSSPAPIGMLADLLAAAVNANVGAWRLSPMASEIEAQTIRWIAELSGYPRDCDGLLVSGGNMANIVGLLAARAGAGGGDIRRDGVGAGARLRVYASEETHTWIHKAADIAGLGTSAIRWISTDEAYRMDVAALRSAIEEDRRAGHLPMIVVATAGTISVGAVDPLAAIAAVCQEFGVWLHVDGAYGGFAAAVPGASPDLDALSRADSLALDPHKWLYAPLEAGCTLVRRPEALSKAFSYHPPYYHFGQQATNYLDLGPQNSRGFRALKVWLALQQAGRNGCARMIADDMALSRRLHARVASHPDLEAVTQALSISTFRFVPPDLRGRVEEEAVATYLDRLNQEVLERVQNSGEAFVSNAVVRGRYLLRACIVNFHTEATDVDALPEIVARLGREVDGALRPSAELTSGSVSPP